MTAVFTLGSLLGVAVLVVIAAVVILGIIICLRACHRKQKAKDTSKSVLYTVQVFLHKQTRSEQALYILSWE